MEYIFIDSSFYSYLHGCDPPIMHGNLNCDTIFIQHNGLMKIGTGSYYFHHFLVMIWFFACQLCKQVYVIVWGNAFCVGGCRWLPLSAVVIISSSLYELLSVWQDLFHLIEQPASTFKNWSRLSLLQSSPKGTRQCLIATRYKLITKKDPLTP